MSSSNTAEQIHGEEWPQDELEVVEQCPVCGDYTRRLLYEDLIDNVFYCAPGKWAAWLCSKCEVGYLSPRPSPSSIHLAYGSYYTHQALARKPAYNELGMIRRLRRRLVNGYTNWRYSTHATPASSLGVPVMLMLWIQRSRLEREYRYLPRLPNGGGTLMDVGCGSGSYLQLAQSAGWQITGIDPDPKAVEVGRKQGLNIVHGGLEQFKGKGRLFDVITLNNVIEHVYDPIATLMDCYNLLNPGGRLFLETPNIKSLGHRVYGRDWRGLEPPRHLVMFSPAALGSALRQAGFKHIYRKSGPSNLMFMTRASEKLRAGLSNDSVFQISTIKKCMVFLGGFIELVHPSTREFITMVAVRSVGGEEELE